MRRANHLRRCSEPNAHSGGKRPASSTAHAKCIRRPEHSAIEHKNFCRACFAMPNLQPCAAKLWGEHSFRLSRTRQQLNRTYFAAGEGIEPARHPWLSRPSRSFFTCTHHAILLRNRCCFPGRPRRHRRRRVAHYPLR